MKEKAERNLAFINRLAALTSEGKTPIEVRDIVCAEYGISNHSFRAWKSRLKLQYAGKYAEAMTPLMAAPSRKPVPIVVVTAQETLDEVPAGATLQ